MHGRWCVTCCSEVVVFRRRSTRLVAGSSCSNVLIAKSPIPPFLLVQGAVPDQQLSQCGQDGLWILAESLNSLDACFVCLEQSAAIGRDDGASSSWGRECESAVKEWKGRRGPLQRK